MEVVKWTSKQMTITRFGVPLAQVKDVRDQVTDGLLNCIAGGPSRKAFLAVQTISEALRGPMNGIDKEEWDRAHAEVLVKLHSALIQNDVSPVVLVRAAMAVRWHAHYGSGASQTAAAAIASLLDKDLSTRVTRALMDGWGRETYNLLAETRGQESEMHRAALVRELLQVKGSPESVSSFLGQLVGDIDTVAGRNYGASFIFISRLIGEVSGLPEAILAMHKEDKTAAMAAYAGAALGVILSRNSSGDRLANLLGSDDSEDSLALVAEAYARHQPSEGYSSADIGILQCVFSSQSQSSSSPRSHLKDRSLDGGTVLPRCLHVALACRDHPEGDDSSGTSQAPVAEASRIGEARRPLDSDLPMSIYEGGARRVFRLLDSTRRACD